MGKTNRLLVTAIFSLAITGCTYVNQQLNEPTVELENRVHNHTRAETFTEAEPTGANLNPGPGMITPELKPATAPSAANTRLANALHDSDGYFVGLAISGGGSRSANFAAACMFQLQRIGLLQHVDYISSVSGGSLTAAYYCLNDKDWNPATLQQKMSYSFATDIWLMGFLPWNMFALAFTDFDRSDLLAATLNVNLFTKDGKSQTYADLLPNRPRLLINATDLQSSRRFVFCNQTFDEINSDLSKYPIGYAVAASASMPVVLHAVTLRNFSTIYPQYRHLLDGGVTDNLGIETLVETYRGQVEAAQHLGLADPYPHGAIFIVLDARVKSDSQVNNQGDPGFVNGVSSALGLTISSLLYRADFASLDDVLLRNAPDDATAKQIREGIQTLNTEGFIEFNNIAGHRIRVADMSLSQLNDIKELPFNGFPELINNISTYFNIDPKNVNALYQAADVLMRDHFEAKLVPLVKEMDANKSEFRKPKSE
jgi:predicted acylesterase/phospholipase RssA